MITIAMLGKIRGMYYHDGKTINEISRLTSLSRSAIKQRPKAPQGSEAKYQPGEVSKKLTPHVEALKQSLTADAQRLKRKRRTTRALRGQLKADGYAGNYSRLTDTIRAWREEQGKTVTVGVFLSMRFEQGNAFQFDWSEQVLQPADCPVFGC